MIMRMRMVAECALFMIIEFGIMILLLFVEKINMFSSVGVFAVSLIYSVAVYYVSKPQKEWDVQDILTKSNMRRMGVAILFFIIVTMLYYVFPVRELNILAVFITLDVLISLLPGSVLLCGSQLWNRNKVVYILTLLVSLTFLFINLFGAKLGEVISFFTNFFGIISIILVVCLMVIIILGLVGITPSNLRRIIRK